MEKESARPTSPLLYRRKSNSASQGDSTASRTRNSPLRFEDACGDLWRGSAQFLPISRPSVVRRTPATPEPYRSHQRGRCTIQESVARLGRLTRVHNAASDLPVLTTEGSNDTQPYRGNSDHIPREHNATQSHLGCPSDPARTRELRPDTSARHEHRNRELSQVLAAYSLTPQTLSNCLTFAIHVPKASY